MAAFGVSLGKADRRLVVTLRFDPCRHIREIRFPRLRSGIGTSVESGWLLPARRAGNLSCKKSRLLEASRRFDVPRRIDKLEFTGDRVLDDRLGECTAI